MTARPSARRKATTPKPEAADATTSPTPGRLEVEYGEKALVNRWATGIERGNSIRTIAKGLEYSMVWFDGKACVAGMPCPSCGAVEITAKRCPSLFISVRGALPANPHRLRCGACDWNASASELLATLLESYTARTKFLEKHFKGYKPVPRDFYAAHLDGKTALDDRSFERAIMQVLPPEHDCEVDICTMVALDQPMAAARLSEANIPWERVNITPEGKIIKTAYEAQLRAEKESRLADELKQFEKQRRKQLRLT